MMCDPAGMDVRRDSCWVASGPAFGSDWCVEDDAPMELVAPGGVVLCRIGTTEPHPDAQAAAAAGWETLNSWLRDAVSQ